MPNRRAPLRTRLVIAVFVALVLGVVIAAVIGAYQRGVSLNDTVPPRPTTTLAPGATAGPSSSAPPATFAAGLTSATLPTSSGTNNAGTLAGIAVTDASTYVAAGSSVARVDRATLTTASTIATPAPVDRLVTIGTTVLGASSAQPGPIVRIDTTASTATVLNGVRGIGLAVAGGQAWTVEGRELRRINLQSGTVDQTISLPLAATNVVADPIGLLWATSSDDRGVRVDPSNKEVVSPVHLPGHLLAVDDTGFLWLTGAKGLVRYDPVNAKELEVIAGGVDDAVAIKPEGIWRARAGLIEWLTLDTGRAQASITVDGKVTGITGDGTSAWAYNADTHQLLHWVPG